MPNIKSAIKAARQNLRHHTINLAALDKIHKSTKNFKKAVATGKLDDANKALSKAFADLDKAAKKNIIHKNTASRRKSRLSTMLAKAMKK